MIALIVGVIVSIIFVIISFLDSVSHDANDPFIAGGAEPEYPYKHLFMSNDEVHERFKRLSKYDLDIVHKPYRVKAHVPHESTLYKGRPTLVEISSDAYEQYDNISDYFQEPQRILCKRVDQPQSPLEYWRSVRNRFSVNLSDMSKRELRELRDRLYEEHYECTTFKPSLMVGFGKMFKATSILDISAGWGDRLIGALALGVPYVGVDPNSALHPGYAKMIDTFAAPNARKRDAYVLVDDTFQDAELPDRDYDLVFSSPPYFNLETYLHGSDDEEAKRRQSDYAVQNVQDWLESFLFPSLRKAWDALTDTRDSHMIININEWRKGPRFIDDMLRFVDKNCEGSEFLGCIGQYSPKRVRNSGNPVYAQPFWIWKKASRKGRERPGK